MQKAAPHVQFRPVPSETANSPGEYFLGVPYRLVEAESCERIFSLYSFLGHLEGINAAAINHKLADSLKFDEYKYAITGIPFEERWTLGKHIKRDEAAERRLFDSLDIRKPYICVHNVVFETDVAINIPDDWRRDYQIVTMDKVTDNPFDWIYTLENASKRILMDSCFANLVEGLNMKGDNYLVLSSALAYTPVFKNGWTFLRPEAD